MRHDQRDINNGSIPQQLFPQWLLASITKRRLLFEVRQLKVFKALGPAEDDGWLNELIGCRTNEISNSEMNFFRELLEWDKQMRLTIPASLIIAPATRELSKPKKVRKAKHLGQVDIFTVFPTPEVPTNTSRTARLPRKANKIINYSEEISSPTPSTPLTLSFLPK